MVRLCILFFFVSNFVSMEVIKFKGKDCTSIETSKKIILDEKIKEVGMGRRVINFFFDDYFGVCIISFLSCFFKVITDRASINICYGLLCLLFFLSFFFMKKILVLFGEIYKKEVNIESGELSFEGIVLAYIGSIFLIVYSSVLCFHCYCITVGSYNIVVNFSRLLKKGFKNKN